MLDGQPLTGGASNSAEIQLAIALWDAHFKEQKRRSGFLPLRRRKGTFSIRINDQFRICFQWTESGPDDVEITDYH